MRATFWTWVAIDVGTKFVPSRRLGDRSVESAIAFVDEIPLFRSRNLCRIHKSLRTTPAMAAGVTDHVWSVADIVSIIDAAESAPAKRGPYKQRAA